MIASLRSCGRVPFSQLLVNRSWSLSSTFSTPVLIDFCWNAINARCHPYPASRPLGESWLVTTPAQCVGRRRGLRNAMTSAERSLPCLSAGYFHPKSVEGLGSDVKVHRRPSAPQIWNLHKIPLRGRRGIESRTRRNIRWLFPGTYSPINFPIDSRVARWPRSLGNVGWPQIWDLPKILQSHTED